MKPPASRCPLRSPKPLRRRKAEESVEAKCENRPLGPTISFRTSKLQHKKKPKTSWCKTRRSVVGIDWSVVL